MINIQRRVLALGLTVLVLTWVIIRPPMASANVLCLTHQSSSTPAFTLWSQEDRYSNRAGKIWVEYDAVNKCRYPVKGWQFRLDLVDAFGDTFFSGTGKVWLKKPAAPGKKIRINKNGGYGVFDLYGSTWKEFSDWKRQRGDSSTKATWRYTVITTV